MQKNNCYITGDWWYTQNLSHRIASHSMPRAIYIYGSE